MKQKGLYEKWLYQMVRSKVLLISGFAICLAFSGCGGFDGYSNQSLYPEDIHSVYVEMFDSQSFLRDVEYSFSDALAKRIEAQTPYKIVDDISLADSVIGGKLVQVGNAALSSERETGRALEREARLRAQVSWKNLKTGELLVENVLVSTSASLLLSPNAGECTALSACNRETNFVIAPHKVSMEL